MTPAERRSLHRAAGLCRCGRERDRTDRVQCHACRVSSCEYQERRRRGVRREPVVRVSDVRRAWIDAPSVGAFSEWLRRLS